MTVAANQKMIKSALRTLERDHGCRVSFTRGQHVKVLGPNGGTVITAHTASCPRTYWNFLAEVKRHLGINLKEKS